jgi:predicted transcriptional regulator
MSEKNLFDREKFCAAIDRCGLSVLEIAEKVGCSNNDIYRYKRGESTPRIGRIKKFVEILGPEFTGLSITTSGPRKSIFTKEEQLSLAWFQSRSRSGMARMLAAYTAIYEFGPSADAEFAADLAGQLIASEEQQKELPG